MFLALINSLYNNYSHILNYDALKQRKEDNKQGKKKSKILKKEENIVKRKEYSKTLIENNCMKNILRAEKCALVVICVL